MARIYDVNDNFFEKIDSEDKSYLLGLIFSDGCISHTNNTFILDFGQMERDKDIVEKFKAALSSTNNILTAKNKFNNNLFYHITIRSKKIYDDLLKYGIRENKSLKVKFDTSLIPQNLIHHFIRGLFDGDGCIWNGKPKKMVVKDRKYKTGKRVRLIHNVKFTYTGNITFVSELQNYLIEVLGIRRTKLNFSKAKGKNSTSLNVCTMEYSGRSNMKKLYNFLYENATIFGERKKNKFTEILELL